MIRTGIDAKGTFKAGDDSNRNLIKDSLQMLRPPAYRSNSSLFIEYYEIGSQDEWKLMEVYGGGDIRHKIYRDLDTRR